MSSKTIQNVPSADEQTALSPKQQAAIEHLVGGANLSDTAAECNIGRTTLYRWMQDQTFKSAYEAARAHAYLQSMRDLRTASNTAVEILRKLMRKEDIPDMIAFRAARATLLLAFRAHENLEIEARLSTLEEQFAVAEQRNGNIRHGC